MLHRGKPIPNMLAGGAIFAVGDIAAQRLTRDATGGFELDASRLGGAACLGAVWSGLCTPAVYHAAEARFPGRAPKAVVLKMLVTCAVLSTVGNRITMFARRALRVPRGVDEASSLRDCARGCDRDLARAIRADCTSGRCTTTKRVRIARHPRPAVNRCADFENEFRGGFFFDSASLVLVLGGFNAGSFNARALGSSRTQQHL